MIDVHDPKNPDSPPIRAFKSNIPAGYVPVSQSAADVPPGDPAPKADTTPHTATKSKE